MPTDLKAVLPAGVLREHMLLLKPSSTRSSTGTSTGDYELVDDDIWAEVVPLEGAQAFYADSLAPKSTTQIRMRYRKDIAAGWVLQSIASGDAYQVSRFPVDVNNRHTILVIYGVMQKRVC